MSEQNEDNVDVTKDLESNPLTPFDLKSGSASEKLEMDSRIGRYVILNQIGKGAFGIVFRAHDEVLQRFVALKLLTRSWSEGQLDAWMAEARVLASLDHPAIVPVFDIGKTKSGQPYIVSKLIDGGSLSQRVSSRVWLISDSVRVITQLAHALDYLHNKGVMHRDIKPTNILTTSKGDAVLADFGLALAESGFGKGSRFVGTPAYMSPEQARYEGHRVDGRSDIYSLGVVFYELMTGSRPFRVKDQEELLDCIRNVEVRPLRQLNPEVPRELERICLKALSKKASDRYATACDFAEDLEHWDEAPQSQLRKQTSEEPTLQAASSNQALDLDSVAVVPHGLRPFDASDSDFFRYLLPGARDRNGVPDSLNFWTNRIRGERPSENFRIGVLLGLSGSGKSSLMKAGVLPLVKDVCHIIFVEAKPELLEANLLQQIRRALPGTDSHKSLRETMIQIRQQPSLRAGKKLLLVIDQFEQWLNYHKQAETTELHETLRQCDGVNVQAILIVRDDFMLEISSFMDQMDEALLQNQNFATVEPFGTAHASKVLIAFGRAYGIIREPITETQLIFVNEAVNGLNKIGRLEPVQIALLADMIKGQEWAPSTLRNLGGIEGLGVAFLEERLAGPSAHPVLRSHLPAVRRILEKLLPTDGAMIKAPACPQSELLHELKSDASESTIAKLLQLLDTEVRLITPASSANSGSGSTSGSTVSDPAYQLTHDYFVQTARKWLDAQESGTQQGRAREQLREISSFWNAKPTNQRLPSFLEWFAIRRATSPKFWTEPERRLMKAASKRFALRSFLVIGILFLMISLGWYARLEMRSSYLASRLVEVDTHGVDNVLRDIAAYRSWVIPKLAAPVDAEDAVETAELLRQRFHVGLALFETNAEQRNDVIDQLGIVEDRNLESIVEYLAPSPAWNNDELFAKLKLSLERDKANALPLAALLCRRQPEHPLWKELAPRVCDKLIQKPSIEIGFWPELLMPIRAHLVPCLLNAGERLSVEPGKSTDGIVSLMVAFAHDDAASLAKTVQWAGVEQMKNLLRSDLPANQLATELRKQLVTSIHRHRVEASPLAPAQASIIQDFEASVWPQFAWTERVPLSQVESCLESMKQLGFRPGSIRPYLLDQDHFVAITWSKTDGEYLCELDMDEAKMMQRFKENQADGYEMLDFATYPMPKPADHPLRWIGLWRKSDIIQKSLQVLLIGENNETRNSESREQNIEGLIPTKHAVRVAPNGDLLHDSLWSRSEVEGERSIEWTRLEFAAGDLYPAFCQSDIRCEDIRATRDRSRRWLEYYEFMDATPAQRKTNAKEWISMAGRLSACGELDRARAVLFDEVPIEVEKLDESDAPSIQRSLFRQQARTLARLANAGELRKLLDDSNITNEISSEERAYLYLRLAVLERNSDDVKRYLQELEQSINQSSACRDYYLRSLATIASLDDTASEANSAFEKLVNLAAPWSKRDAELADVFLDFDFDALRTRREWQQLLEHLKLTRRITCCLRLHDGIETKAIYSKPQADHKIEAMALAEQGYHPTCWHVCSSPQGQLLVSSIWERPLTPASALAIRTRQEAAIALALARLGETDAIVDCLSGKWGTSLQTAVIAQAPLVIEAEQMVTLLRQSSNTTLQRTLISTIGGYAPQRLSASSLEYLSIRLKDWAETSTDASLVSVSRWCLTQWNEKLPALKSAQALTKDRNWYTNTLGQRLVVVEPQGLVLVGKPDERRFWIEIGRRFAIGASEVTGAEFADFLEDPRVQEWMATDPSQRLVTPAPPNHPQNAVPWLLAMRYCQWLNEREGIPQDQWCYRNVWEDSENAIIPEPNYLERTGYRLPTHAEWEFACGNGSLDPWHFGNDDSLIGLFEWTSRQSQNRPQPVMQLRPNALGLFDMSGNLAEWTDSYYQQPLRETTSSYQRDSGNPVKDRSQFRMLAGGRFKLGAPSAVTNSASVNAPEYLSATTGLRIARTLPKE